MVDSSTSICDNSQLQSCTNWNDILRFVNKIIDAFKIGEDDTRVGFVTFSSDATFVFPMDRYFNKRELQEAVLGVDFLGGTTNTGKGLQIARSLCFSKYNGERENVSNIAVVITDGLPTEFLIDPVASARLLQSIANVVAVGITDNVETYFLKLISSKPHKENENFFSVADFSGLKNILKIAVTQTCQAPLRTIPTSTSTNSAITGINEGQIELFPNHTSYFKHTIKADIAAALTCLPKIPVLLILDGALECFNEADVCFVLDSSQSICGDSYSCQDWMSLLHFVNRIIDVFTIGSGATRVGVVIFSNNATLAFPLDRYSEMGEIKKAVSAIQYIGSTTNTGKALQVTRQTCFHANFGERPGVPNIAIVITDGLPTEFEVDVKTEATKLNNIASVLVVGVTETIEPQFLQMISSAPQRQGENFFLTPDFSGLDNILKTLVKETCRAPLKTTPPTTLMPDLECFSRADVCFVLDSSQSICGDSSGCEDWISLLDFVNKIIDVFTIGSDATRVGVVIFSNDANLVFPLDKYTEKEEIKKAVFTMRYIGSTTNTGKALHITRQTCFHPNFGERPGVPNIAIIITDGLPTEFEMDVKTEAAKLNHIASVLVVGVTETIEPQFLQMMSSAPQRQGENFFLTPDFSGLDNILKTLVKETCRAPLRTTSSTTPMADLECFSRADVCFVLDSSQSICGDRGGCQDWMSLLEFVNRIIDAFTIGSDATRVGVVIFSRDANLALALNRHSSKGEIKEAVSAIKYIGSTTNTGKALHVTRQTCFHPNFGERPGVPNIAIIITDGLPTEFEMDVKTEAAKLNHIASVLVVGVTETIEPQFLQMMSSTPQRQGENFFLTPDFLGLDSILKTLVQETCRAPLKTTPITTSKPDLECFSKADVCFVIDSSRSICGGISEMGSCQNWNSVLVFVNEVIDAFNIGYENTRVGVVTFSDDAMLSFPMNKYYLPKDLKSAVSAVSYIGSTTNTGKALRLTRQACFDSQFGERPHVPNIAIVITDGLPTVFEYDTNTEATELKQIATTIAVGVTKDVEPVFLKLISSLPQRANENYFSAPDFASLEHILQSLVKETCKAPLRTNVTLTTTSVPGTSATTTNTVSTTVTSAQNPQSVTKCSAQADICFIIDSSLSICEENLDAGSCPNWRSLLSFVSDMVGTMAIGMNYTRVGIVLFSNDAYVLFPMDRFSTKAELKKAIAAVPYLGSGTNTGKALRVAKTACFNSLFGERPDVPDIAVLITDGLPTTNEYDAIAEANALRQTTNTIAVGIANNVEQFFLKQISSLPQQENRNYFLAPSVSGLPNMLSPLVKQVCTIALETPKPVQHGSVIAPLTPVRDCPSSADVCFIIDSSESICNKSLTQNDCSDWSYIKVFVANLIQGFHVGKEKTRIGIVTFSSGASFIPLDHYTNNVDIQKAATLLPYLGTKNDIGNALKFTREMCFNPKFGERSNIPNVAILISNGLPTATIFDVQEEASSLQQIAKVFTIGILENIDSFILKEMSSQPQKENKNYFLVPSLQKLDLVVNKVMVEICQAVTTNLVLVPPPILNCNEQADICLLVDSSRSICEDSPVETCRNWGYLLNFIKDLIGMLPIGNRKTRVGAVSFSDDATLNFPMDMYDNVKDLGEAVLNIPYLGDSTNTGKALKIAREVCFSSKFGERPHVKNIAILITDGLPTVLKYDAKLQADDLKRIADVMVLGIGPFADPFFLTMISQEGLNTFRINSFQKLENITKQIAHRVCQIPFLSTSTVTVPSTSQDSQTVPKSTMTTTPPLSKQVEGNLKHLTFYHNYTLQQGVVTLLQIPVTIKNHHLIAFNGNNSHKLAFTKVHSKFYFPGFKLVGIYI